jgi:two-component system sensor histidine kinase HydH
MLTQSPGITGAGDEGCSLLSVLQDCLACGVLTVDSEREHIAVTPDAAAVLGIPADGRGPAPTFAALPASLQSIIREVQSAGCNIADRQVDLPSSRGAAQIVLVTALSIPPGKPGGSVVLVIRDLLPAGKVEQDLKRLNRLASLGTLSASMAHEIKNALVPIKTFVDLLLEKDKDAELAETVRREMRRVNTIVSSMLRFAAPAKPARAPVKLHDLLDHSLRLARHRAEGKMISFERRFDASSDLLTGDDHQLQQAVVNLLLNAVESMGAQGTVTIATDIFESEAEPALHEGAGGSRVLRLTISDTGAGIAPEIVESIFEPFFTTKRDGTGLGLAVTRRIIEEHRGSVGVQSRPGEGTTFTVLLPAGPAPQPVPKSAATGS